MSDFPQISAQIIAIVIGLTQAAKGFGAEGKVALGFSMASGFLLGLFYQISLIGTPEDFNAWFGVVLAGLIHGLAPSGLYEATTRVLTKAIVAANGEAG